jgi:hypothetical protein
MGRRIGSFGSAGTVRGSFLRGEYPHNTLILSDLALQGASWRPAA